MNTYSPGRKGPKWRSHKTKHVISLLGRGGLGHTEIEDSITIEDDKVKATKVFWKWVKENPRSTIFFETTETSSYVPCYDIMCPHGESCVEAIRYEEV